MRSKTLAFLTVSMALLQGCGGSGGRTSQPNTSDQSTSVGSAKVSFSGNAKPLVSTSTSGVTVQGLSGAAFSYIDLYPQPSLLNTMLLYEYNNQVYTYSFLTGQSQQITHFNLTTGSQDVAPPASWGPSGLVLLPYQGHLIQMYADGQPRHESALNGSRIKPSHVLGRNQDRRSGRLW